MATNNSNRWSNFKTNNSVLGGRYDRGQVYGQRINNDITSQKAWATDPWFQLGSSIGQSWGDAYNERGISKGRNEMNEALNGYLGQFASQPKTDVEQGGMFNNNMPGTMPSEEMLNNNSAQIQGGVLGGLDNVITPMTPQEAYKAYKNDAWVSKYRGDDPNPDGSAISVKNDTQQMNQLASSVDFGKVDKEQAREYVRQQLEQKGRTPYQIDQVLGNFDSIYDSKYGKWKENKGTTFLQNGINALNGDNPDYKNALMNMYAAAEYGNPQAKMYIQQIQYERARQDKIDAENRALANQKALIDYKYGLTGGGRAGRSTKAVEYDENGNPIIKKKTTNKTQSDAETMLQKSIDWYQKEYDATIKSLGSIDQETNPSEYASLQDDALKLQQALKQEKNKLFYLRDGAPFHDDYWMGGVGASGDFILGSFANQDGGENDDGININDQNQSDADILGRDKAYVPPTKRGGGWVDPTAKKVSIFSDEYWNNIENKNKKGY